LLRLIQDRTTTQEKLPSNNTASVSIPQSFHDCRFGHHTLGIQPIASTDSTDSTARKRLALVPSPCVAIDALGTGHSFYDYSQ
jgi:hypothetical protein